MLSNGALVSLRPVEEADLEAFFRHQADPEAAAAAAFPPRGREDFMRHWREILPQTTTMVRTIVVEKECVGHIVAWGLADRPLIGYWVDRHHWGKGIATEALGQFVELNTVRPLYAMVAEHNDASIRVLEKAGFHREGGTDAPPIVGSDGVGEFVYVLNR